jgi:hypothetical protein
MAEVIGTKSVIQIRSHAQKYFLKLDKDGKHADIPPARAKKRASHPYPKSRPGNNKSLSYSWNAQQEQLNAAASAATNAFQAQVHQAQHQQQYASAAASPAAAAAQPHRQHPNSAPQFATNPAFAAAPALSSPAYFPSSRLASYGELESQQQHDDGASQLHQHQRQQYSIQQQPMPSTPRSQLQLSHAAHGSPIPAHEDDEPQTADTTVDNSDGAAAASHVAHSDSLSLLSSVSSALPPASPLQKAEARRRAEAARALRAKEAARMPPQYPMPPMYSPPPASHNGNSAAALATPISAFRTAYSSALAPSAAAAFAHTPLLSPTAGRSSVTGTGGGGGAGTTGAASSGSSSMMLFHTPTFSADSSNGHRSGSRASSGAGFSFSTAKKLGTTNGGEEEEGKVDELPGRLNFDDAALEGTEADAHSAAAAAAAEMERARKRKASASAEPDSSELWPTHAIHPTQLRQSQPAVAHVHPPTPLDGEHVSKRARLSSSGTASPLQHHNTSPYLFEDANGVPPAAVKVEARSVSAHTPPFGALASHRNTSVDWSNGAGQQHGNKPKIEPHALSDGLHPPSSPLPFEDAAAAAVHHHPRHYGLAHAVPSMAFSPFPAGASDSHNDSSSASASSSSSAHTARLSGSSHAGDESKDGQMHVHVDFVSAAASSSSSTTASTSGASSEASSMTPLKSHPSSVTSSFFSPNIMSSPFGASGSGNGGGAAAAAVAGAALHLFSPAPHSFAPLPTPREFHTPPQQKHGLALPSFSPVPTPSFF